MNSDCGETDEAEKKLQSLKLLLRILFEMYFFFKYFKGFTFSVFKKKTTNK